MARDPRHSLVYGRNGRPLRNRWPANDMDRQSQMPCGFDFGISCIAAGVLRKYVRNAMSTKESDIVIHSERAASRNDGRLRKLGRQFKRIDHADDVTMLRLRTELRNGRPAERGKNIRPLNGKRRNRVIDGRMLTPNVIDRLFPSGSFDGEQRYVCLGTSSDGIVADLRREGMRCVDNDIDLFTHQIVRKTLKTPEPADPRRKWTGTCVLRPSRERERRGNIAEFRQPLRDQSRFGRTTEQKKFERLWPDRIHDMSPMP